MRSRQREIALRANHEFNRARATGIRIRTKFVNVRSRRNPHDFYSASWNINFARIQKLYDKAYHGITKSAAVTPKLDSQAIEWVDSTLSHLKSSTKPLRILTIFDKRKSTALQRWQQVAIWLLYHEKERMVDFLRATNVEPYPPLTCMEDSMQYLATHFSQVDDSMRGKHLQSLGRLFIDIANQRGLNRLRMDGSFFRLLIPHCTNEQINEFYRTIKLRHVKVSWHTFLHFATHFAKHDRFEQALDAILEAKSAGAALHSYALRSTCATLLRTAIRLPGGLRATMRIVSNLVKIGLPLNIHLCNIIMLNAVEAGDLKTAFSIYHSLVEHGLNADAYTYCILLKGCKANIDDAETLNTTIRSAIQGTTVAEHIVLATEILHCLAVHHTRKTPENAFETVSNAYALLFNLEPLEKLGLPLPKPSQPFGQAQPKLQPNQYALGIMLATYLDQYFAHNRTTALVYDLYLRLRALVEIGEEPFNTLAETDHVANTFLSAFIRTKKGLLYATEVIKDMQRPLPPAAKAKQCQPTTHTWSIFLHGFTRHRQVTLAEEVLIYMRGKGIEPNQVTWNTLLGGYAAAQDLDGTLDALRRAEADGLAWDEWTMGGLRRLVDQQKLKDRYREQRLAASLDFTKDLKDSLGERLSSSEEITQESGEKSLVGDAHDGQSAKSDIEPAGS